MTSLETLSLEDCRELQRLLASWAVLADRLPKIIKYVAGVDAAHVNDKALAAVAVLRYPELEVVERKAARVTCRFPYIPTLLAFREGPAICEAIDKLELTPDVLLIDGHGSAHPLGCGLATHVGVLMNVATIGVAKGKLFGEVGDFRGNWAPLKADGKVIGAAVVTAKGREPVYVSPGHNVDLNRAIDIVIRCAKDRIPEPIKVAHVTANEEKRKFRRAKF